MRITTNAAHVCDNTQAWQNCYVEIKDSISTAKGTQDGLSLCGARTYTLSDPFGVTTMTVAGNRATISLATSDVAKITSTRAQAYENVTLTVCLASYPAVNCGTYVI